MLNYFHQNQAEMRRVIETEVDVSVEKDGYMLAGNIDLLMGEDGKLEILDFKSSQRPGQPRADCGVRAPALHLCPYPGTTLRQAAERLLLYWTAEPCKQDALVVLSYDQKRVEEAGLHFDETVRRIQAREFAVTTPPEAAICKECDLRMLCHADGVISREARG